MITFEQFKLLAKKGNLIPIYREIPADIDTPVTVFLKVKTGDHDFLLESVEGGEKWGRYSFIGTKPAVLFRCRGKKVEIIRDKKKKVFKEVQDPLQKLKNLLADYRAVRISGLPRFFGGAVGYFSYDMVRNFESLPKTTKDELSLDDGYFVVTDTVIIFDNLKGVIKVVANVHIQSKKILSQAFKEGVAKVDSLVKKISQPISPPKKKLKRGPLSIKVRHTKKEFCSMVEKVREYIKSGDVFQTVVSTRFEGNSPIDPFDLYRSLRVMEPSPYLYFLDFGDSKVVGASPEVMVRVDEGRVTLRPIAGTRRRGRNMEDEARMEMELKGDPKERAEHIMLVDLGRNDLGRVCVPASVKVEEMERVERYSQVMHLVSHITGNLNKRYDVFDVLKAAFPAGTLTGAPKIRAMEIIEELERVKRGIYGGCVGYISFTGNMDMAITIRTALFKNGKFYIQTGAGIVYNSIPEQEYLECKNKAKGLIKALEGLMS